VFNIGDGDFALGLTYVVTSVISQVKWLTIVRVESDTVGHLSQNGTTALLNVQSLSQSPHESPTTRLHHDILNTVPPVLQKSQYASK
jgi:hypothetical protein